MKRMSARLLFLMLICTGTFLTGCSEGKEVEIQETAEESGILPEADESGKAEENKVKLPEPEEEEEAVPDEEPVEIMTGYQVIDVTDLVKEETEVDRSLEERQETLEPPDTAAKNTVKFVESTREEIMETVRELSVIDEADPDTYKIIKTEQEVPVVAEIPLEYSDDAGYVRYALEDGVWYEYRYSNGDITLDVEDEELALLLLEYDGSYDNFERIDIHSSTVADDGSGVLYAYRVTYREKIPMEGEPSEVKNLIVTKSTSETTMEKTVVEEKIPVETEREVGTGEYRYYGWQKLGDEIFYFDKNGEKVTGEQVIRGIRYLFDKHGVLQDSTGIDISSRNGKVDWSQVRRSRITYAILRGGYRGAASGDLILDSCFEENVVGARREGLEVGICFFSQAVTEQEAVEEASMAVALADKYQITTPIAVIADYAKTDLSGRADGLSAADRTACVNAFLKTVQNAGHTPMLRAKDSFLVNNLDSVGLVPCEIWVEQYDTELSYTGPYRIWRYSSRGDVDGIGGYTGLNLSHE